MEHSTLLDSLFNCPPCFLEDCPKPSRMNCLLVREPGICGCCYLCASDKGERCGLSQGRCVPSLRCKPAPNDPTPLQSLLLGRGVCM
ncbi:hypothetical protein SNE40_002724 [Patella caerulea]|uniref:IGFBP N-terminal domain-containing protein n=1 Tax=Patella caerulea TaxID=87958 RepID=A0AAN8Q047_PATCE